MVCPNLFFVAVTLLFLTCYGYNQDVLIYLFVPDG